MKLQELFAGMQLAESDSLILLSDANWKEKATFPSRVFKLLDDNIILRPKAIFCFDNKPLILFYENPENKRALHDAIWNFNETPIVIILENEDVEIFNGFCIDEHKGLLKRIGGHEKLDDFGYFKLVTGKTWEDYSYDLTYLNRVDNKLLENIDAVQNELSVKYGLPRSVANALLGKIIFIRYLIDRKVKLCFEGISKVWTSEDFLISLDNQQRTYDFFEYLQDKEKGFNGDLFPISKDEFDKISPSAFGLLKRMLNGDEITTGQQSLFQFYDFSILPIEFISNVYEKFIGKDNQAKEGAFYTPTFLVDYIIRETVDKKVNSSDSNFNCRVLDPSCGSGIFLVEALRKIIEKYIKVTGNNANTEDFRAALKKLALDNIFGIDKDESAIQVAIFSVYLTLLDYLKPAEIENFKFPNLLGTNFFKSDFFDLEQPFNEQLSISKISFDFIIGNPPWKRGKSEQDPLYVKYIEKRSKKENKKDVPECKIGNKEIAQAFLLRCNDFSTGTTQCALIVTSKTLYNLQSVEFRRYFLDNFVVDRVFELAPVRREVFEKSNKKAIAPACILFYHDAKGSTTDANIIEHIAVKPSRFFTLFKIFTINRTDFKRVQQVKLKEFDWLWKVLVYGSYLDFNFIKRLKDDYPTIKLTMEKNNLSIGQGIMVGGGDENDASHLIGKRFIDTKTDIQRFWVNPENKKTMDIPVVHRVREAQLFNAPMLLMTGGTKNDLKSVAAVCYFDAIYKSSLTGIICNNHNSNELLRIISGILNSSFSAYYNLMTFSSSGIEREETHDEEKLSMLFCNSNEVEKSVVEIEDLLLKSYGNNSLFDAINENKIASEIEKIETSIFKGFSCSEQENDLLDYVNQIVIPIQMEHEGFEVLYRPVSYRDDHRDLENYAKLFFDRFRSGLGKNGKKFIVEIWHTNQVVGMFFKVVAEDEFKDEIVWFSKQNDTDILPFLIQISAEKITDRLFVQKDIRGFEKDYFYIFKPNEKRLWHKAIGYLDVNEFADAILKAGRDSQ